MEPEVRPKEEQTPLGELMPAKLGRFRVIRKLAQGGMGTVFEGRHEDLDNRVALKVLNPTLSTEPRSVERFLREARAVSKIDHQHVVHVFDLGKEGSLLYIAMEFLDGRDLAALLRERGPLPVQGIVQLFLPILSAVGAAHAAGIVHRDLKPANVMLAHRPPSGFHPTVLDFGVSKLLDEGSEGALTRPELLLGTVPYLSPELLRGAQAASAFSDQYALGVMLYECATGVRPFEGSNDYDLMHAVLTAPVRPPSTLRPELPPEFDAIVLRALKRSPEGRFASLRALGSALLLFGSPGSLARWQAEFLDRPATSASTDCWAPSASTLADGGASRRAIDPQSESRFHVLGERSRALNRAMVILCAAAFVLSSLLFIASQRKVETPNAAAEQRVADAVSHPMPPQSPALAELAAYQVPLPASPAVGSAAAKVASTSRQRAAGLERSATRPRKLAPPAASSSSEPAREVDPALDEATPARSNSIFHRAIGTNGAPILE